MQKIRPISFSLLASLAIASAVEARSLRDDGLPAEVPPASFTGNQYVDSRGCVFIRAGVDGATSWIPRVTRDRKLVCGFQPTNIAVATIVTEADKPEVIEIAPPPAEVVAAPVVAAPKPAPVRVTAPRPVAPRPVAQPAPVAPPMPAAPAFVAEGCGHLSAQSQQYLSHPTAAVRCGSQGQTAHATLTAPSAAYAMPSYQDQNGQMVSAGVYPGQLVKLNSTAQGDTFIPQHLYESHVKGLEVVEPPAGYRTVWKDDRLNPHRGVQSMNGHGQMAQVWTADKVPMTTPMPADTQVQTTVTSRSAATPSIVLTPNTYVQVAAYHSSEDAQRVAKRVRKLGLPVRIGHMTQGYQDVRLVLAGPFASAAQAQSALSVARSAGYANARIR